MRPSEHVHQFGSSAQPRGVSADGSSTTDEPVANPPGVTCESLRMVGVGESLLAAAPVLDCCISPRCPPAGADARCASDRCGEALGFAPAKSDIDVHALDVLFDRLSPLRDGVFCDEG